MKKHGEIVNRFNYNLGKTNKAKDIVLEALPPGKRVSINGNIYWESRANRSDLSQKKRL